jgi:hypothetical protein
MIGQAVVEINKGAPLQILWFDEGRPYNRLCLRHD